MGLSLSKILADANPTAPPKIVLVPPMFERDVKDRDRFAYNSYDYLFAKRQLHFLFSDYVQHPGPQRMVPMRGLFRFSPPADTRLSVEADVGPQPSMNVRYQPLGAANTPTFIDVRANPLTPGDVTMRASWLDPATGFGLFATAPMAKRVSGTLAQFGARYSSPNFTVGAITTPRTGSLSTLWAAGRYDALMAGVTVRLDGVGALPHPGQPGAAHSEAIGDWLRGRTRAAIAYEPTFVNETGRGSFSVVMEMVEDQSFVLSFFQHMAISRRVLNPMEKADVVGITNYVDIGMQLVVPTSVAEEPAAAAAAAAVSPDAIKDASSPSSAVAQSPAAASAGPGQGSVNVAGAWQINKNLLLKGVVGSDAVSLSVAAKTWGRLGLVGAASVCYKYGDKDVRVGGWLQLENFGALRYERGLSDASGRGVLQRHEASQQDVENVEGTRRVVAESAEASAYNAPLDDLSRNLL